MKYKIEIKEPCSENWDNMTSTEKGRFCAVCQAEVIDFTTQSNAEITAFLHAGKKSCGRYKQSQIDQEYYIPEASKLRHRYFRYGLTAGLSLLSFVGFGQETKEKIVMVVSQKIEKKTVSTLDSLVIKGVVLDEKGEFLYGASVLEVGTMGNGTTTDFDGRFEFLTSGKGDSISLEISYTGFETKIFTVSQDSKSELRAVLKEGYLTGDVIVVGGVGHKRTFWQKVKRFFRRKR